MNTHFDFIDELKSLLQGSDSRLRKHWAARIVNERMPVADLMVLLHGHEKTAQRFTWLIGDLLEIEPKVVSPCLPLLYELRDQMPFPGMQRTVGKCLWTIGVPKELEKDAVAQMFKWLDDDQFEVSIKHYAAKVLYDLAIEDRIDVKKLDRVLKKQTQHPTKAHANRMLKLRLKLSKSVASKK